MADAHPTWHSHTSHWLAEKIASELAESESVLWIGRPRREMPPSALQWSRMITFIMLGIVGVVLALALDDIAQIIFGIVGGCSWLVVLGGLVLPALWRLGVVQSTVAYVVTNRRVIICWRSGVQNAQLRSYTPADLGDMVCLVRDDGSGDIRFDGDSDHPSRLNEGFCNINGVLEVERLIRETLLPK
jgi:hypothetical protein